MRYVNGFFCVVLTLFALVQYNDPDAVLWIVVYGVAALWSGVAAFRPTVLAPKASALVAYAVSLAAVALGCLYLWPALPGNWIQIEEEREGLGMIITTVSLIVVGLAWWSQARRREGIA